MTKEETTIYQLKYISDFRCDSSKCKQNCCQLYSIWIEDYDYELLSTKAPEIAQCIHKTEGKYLIPSNDHSCIFLNDGLCSIHSQHDEYTIPEVCYTYPRLYFGIDNTIYVSSNLLCDYLIKLIYTSNEPFKLIENVSTRIPKYVEEQKQLTENNFKDLYNNNIISLYKETLKIADNENLTSSEVLLSLIELANIFDNNPCDQWMNLINNHISTFDPSKTTVFPDKDDVLRLKNLIIDIFLENSTKEYNQRRISLLNDIKKDIDKIKTPLNKEKESFLKTYLKIKLSENFFPVNAWYSCLTEISLIVSGYILLKEVLQTLKDPQIDDVATAITTFEPILLINRGDLFVSYYNNKLNTYESLKTLVI